jgi:HAD superfamily hydrolase (TIGR01490 family)
LIRSFLKKGKVPLLKALKLFCWFALYKVGFFSGSTEGLRRNSYPLLSAWPSDDVDDEICETYQKLIRPAFNQRICERVRWHQQNGHYVIAVSGTLLPFCEMICREIGIAEFYGTRLLRESGHYTSQWVGNILEGEEKARFVLELARKRAIDLDGSYAYADKYSDLEFLKTVRHPVAVDPDARLRAVASDKQWEIFGNGS